MPEGGWRAPGALLAVAAASFAVYQTAGRAVAEIAIVPYAACLVLGASWVYPRLRRRGAGIRAAVAASLLLPFVWLAKEAVRVSAVFGPAETLYYAFNPISLGVFSAAALQMAVWELAVGQARRGPLVVLGVLAAAALASYGIAADSGGRELFYGYIAGYRWLFGE
jgi:hypothetical protein